MNVQRILDEKIKNYTQNNGQKLIEQTLWNNSTVVYTIEDKQNMEMSLIAIYLEKEKAYLKDTIEKICEDSKKTEYLVKCNQWTTEKLNEGQIIVIETEKITTLIEMALDENITLADNTEEEKKTWLCNLMENVTECVEYIIKKYPGFNIYINNEEICINEAGQGKILLFDLINNEVKTNNEAYEIVTIFKQVANGMNIKFSIKIQEQKIENLRKECLEYIERHKRKNEKDKKLFKENIKKANNGNKESEFVIGYLYENGRGVPQNINEAVKWYRKSAKKKYTKALNNLAYLYQNGNGVEKDIRKAEELLKMSAKQGDDVACLNLGILYQTNNEINMENAKFWYKKAMNKGNEVAERMYKRIREKENL